MNGLNKTALAVVAHPDDVEFMIAGTLLLLKSVGYKIHVWNLANGALGTAHLSHTEIAAIRWQEAQAAAASIGAKAHPPLFEDLAIFYDRASLACVAAGIRQIRPTVVFTHHPFDYMEDHQNTAKLVATAVFSRAMRNFNTDPPESSYADPVALYHAMPHGLQDPLGETPTPSHYVNIGTVIEAKRQMLEKHQSQKDWLDVSQGMDAYLLEMKRLSRAVGGMSQRFALAEGFVQHSSIGFCAPTHDPLKAALDEAVYRPKSLLPSQPY